MMFESKVKINMLKICLTACNITSSIIEPVHEISCTGSFVLARLVMLRR